MKNVFKLMFVLMMSSTVMFTSCSQDNSRQVEEASLESKIANDADLKDAINGLVSLAELRANDASQEAQNAVVVGIGVSLVKMYERHPELGQLSQEEANALFSRVISNNHELMDLVAGLDGAAFKACPLKDLCGLAVTIGNLFLRPVVCDAIVGAITIPIIGPLVCNVAMLLITGLLNGVCDALPC